MKTEMKEHVESARMSGRLDTFNDVYDVIIKAIGKGYDHQDVFRLFHMIKELKDETTN